MAKAIMVDLLQVPEMGAVVVLAQLVEMEQVAVEVLVVQAYLHLLLELLLYMAAEVVEVLWAVLLGQEGQVVVEQALLIKRLRQQAQLTPVAVEVAVDII
jgi:hypothetical protein